MKRIILGAIAALLMAAAPAEATDLGSGRSSGSKDFGDTHHWGGFYGAVYGGGSVSNATLDYGGISFGQEGVFVGGRVGGDYVLPNDFVIGLYAEGGWSRASANFVGVSINQDYEWAVGAKLGRVLNRNLEAYALVAYTQEGQNADAINFSRALHGVELAGGLEYQIGAGWGVFGEAGYAWYGDVDLAHGVTLSTDKALARVGIIKRF